MKPSVPNAVLIAASTLILLATCASLGTRLLWMARGREQAPERFAGVGLIVLTALTYPLLGASRIGAGVVGDIRMVTLALALLSMIVAVFCLAIFTQRVFRPSGGLGTVGVAVIGLSAFLAAGVVLSLLHGADPSLTAREALFPWGLLLRVPLQLVWIWTGIEGVREWQRARRRQALGLSDPVVVNRFFLWGLFGLLMFLAGVVSSVFQAAGRTILDDPIAVLPTLIASVVGSALLFLVLCPPASYVRRIQASAGSA